MPFFGMRARDLLLAIFLMTAPQKSIAGEHTPPARTFTPTLHASFIVAQDNPFNALVGKRRVRSRRDRVAGKVQRYILSGGKREFLFQEVGERALIQFQCLPDDKRVDCLIDQEAPASEIITLLPIRAPRGDIIYKNDQGDTVLRIASYGGATVWWPGALDAQPASRSYSDRQQLTLSRASRGIVVARSNRASAIVSAMTGSPIIFDSGLSFRESAPPRQSEIDLLADAVTVTTIAVANVASDPTGARVLANRLTRVEFEHMTREAAGSKSNNNNEAIALNGTTLTITIDPASGLQGRVSSAQITRFLEENL